MKSFSKLTALVFALVMALTLVACGQGAGSSASSSASAQSGSASASASASTSASASASSATTGELAGKPWVTSVLSGNLPAEQPEAKDDVYTHYNYEYLAAHQGQNASTMSEHANELQTTVAAIIKDESKTGHDLDQLRILYNQASDAEALKAAGLSEIQPYLDRIDAVTSLDEMNKLLTAEDFPFSPFILTFITINNTQGTNIVAISPNFVLCDPLIYGGTYYQDSDDPQEQQALANALDYQSIKPLIDLMEAGMSDEEIADASQKLIAFEKAYGKYAETNDAFLKADYGALADSVRDSFFTLDELCSLAPNFPLKETLDKMGRGGSETYSSSKGWIAAFNDLWTEDNLDTIKLVAKAKVLAETRPYRDPTFMNNILVNASMSVDDASTFAYNACSSLDTLGNVVAKTYVDDVLGANAKERLTKLAQDVIAEYKNLLSATSWMSEGSRQSSVEKLDNMTLNILEPTGGYFDYSGLELTPTDQGGTLFSNYLKLKQYRQDCENKLIGQPAVAASTWFQVSPTMNNAFYDPMGNSINIFPGFVTSLVYTNEMSDAELLGVAGFTMSHEITHGFDYQGSQLDAYGRPNPVFSDADVDGFVLKSSALARYYQNIEVLPGQTVNGQSVVGEAAADLGGMQISLELASKIDGFDYNNYFAAVSNMWAKVMNESELQRQALDVHPLPNLRVNVNLQMYDPIYDVLGVTEGDGMYLAPSERIIFWGPNA